MDNVGGDCRLVKCVVGIRVYAKALQNNMGIVHELPMLSSKKHDTLLI